MGPNVLATFVTTTTYGTWLPGDLRGYVHDGVILPPQPRLLAHAQTTLGQEPMYFTDVQQIVVFHALLAATKEFGYSLTDASVEPWHLHWIVTHGYDSVPTMVGRLKNRMRQALRRGRVWTAGYCHRCMYTPEEIATCRRYIARHAGVRMIDGQRIERGRHNEKSPAEGRV